MREAFKKKVSGYILAGGKSSRMGTDKGLLDFKGKMIIEQIIEQFRPAVNNLVIVSNNEVYRQFGLTVIPDIIKDMGPAGGIFAALTHSDSEQNFILGCDMPFVNTAAIQFIIDHAVQAQVIIPVRDGKMEPLFGVYSKSCLLQWHELIQQGFLKLQEMVKQVSLLQIDTNDNPLFNYPLFVNINTPEEFKNALINTNLR